MAAGSIHSERSAILQVRILNIQKTNIIEKGIGTLAINTEPRLKSIWQTEI